MKNVLKYIYPNDIYPNEKCALKCMYMNKKCMP